jgi:hypothetical protein
MKRVYKRDSRRRLGIRQSFAIGAIARSNDGGRCGDYGMVGALAQECGGHLRPRNIPIFPVRMR